MRPKTYSYKDIDGNHWPDAPMGEEGIYSHYCYYDLTVPRRRLGVYTFLQEIEMCRERGWSHLYIGFLNMQAKKLRYKEQFSGLEVLVPEHGWVPFESTKLVDAPPLDSAETSDD